MVFYDSMGGAVERILLDSRSGHYGVHIPKGQWHAVEVIEPSVILEVKDGPYMPLQQNCFRYCQYIPPVSFLKWGRRDFYLWKSMLNFARQYI